MFMKRKSITRLATLAAVLVAMFLVEVNFGPIVSSNQELHLSYVVKTASGEDFEVELRATGLRGRQPRFRILNGWGVLQDQDSHIVDIRAEDEGGESIEVHRENRDGETSWRLARRPQGEMRLTYRVRPYDPYRSPEASFVDSHRFVVLGYSVFLLPENVSNYDQNPISVRVDTPVGWEVWGSWPRVGDRFHPPTTHDLWSGVAAGGEFNPSRLEAGEVSVTVLTEPPIPDLMGITIANRLLPVMREMYSLFGAPPRGDSLQVLALYRVAPFQDRMSTMSGNSEEGAFLCLASPDRYRNADPLTVLAIHECLHFYLGGAISASPEPPFRNAPDLVWLMEGVTEYLTFSLMERAGILTPGELERVVTKKEKEYLDTHGSATYTLADAARRMQDLDVYGLVYSKGFLVGKLLDQKMEQLCGPGTFEKAIRALFEKHNFYRTGDVVTPKQVREIFEEYCQDSGLIIELYAHGNRKLPPLSTGHPSTGIAATTR
jgi:predicted metalloprotease with PDZ domain